jgi:hypothetical protein
MTLQSDNGVLLPDDIIVGCSITTIYGKHRLYVRQIYRNGTSARITIASAFDDSVLGMFSGDVSSDFTTLRLVPFVRNISGSMTIGSATSLHSLTTTLHFSKESSELEESTIFCYTPPAVSSVSDKNGAQLRGDVKFGVLTNLTKTVDTLNKTSRLTATNPGSVFNKADKSTILDNCPNPIIKNINGVQPFAMGGLNNPYSDNDGNIYIVGVNPIIFYGTNVSETQGSVKIQTDNVTLASLCAQKHKLLPPTDVCGFTDPVDKNKYYSKAALAAVLADDPTCTFEHPARLAGSYYDATRPEYYFWPQFVKDEYYEMYWKQ